MSSNADDKLLPYCIEPNYKVYYEIHYIQWAVRHMEEF